MRLRKVAEIVGVGCREGMNLLGLLLRRASDEPSSNGRAVFRLERPQQLLLGDREPLAR